VVSAIGHEPDSPLLDLVADRRCSTPTDAGKTVVPDVAEETARIHQLRDRARRALHGWVDTQRRLLEQIRSRPSLADPLGLIEHRAAEIEAQVERGRRAILTTVSHEQSALAAARARLAALGPSATLERGYAVVQYLDAESEFRVLRSVSEVAEGTPLRVRLADGAVRAIAGEPER
jgi:exodeoxyribonuclease VII large subunit